MKTKPAPAPAPAPSAEQLAAESLIRERWALHDAARKACLERALAFAKQLTPRVTERAAGGFLVMFGDKTQRGCSFAGPGIVELTVELAPLPSQVYRAVEAGEVVPPVLRFSPRCYSLGSDATLDSCEAQGAALVEAARFGRTINALTA